MTDRRFKTPAVTTKYSKRSKDIRKQRLVGESCNQASLMWDEEGLWSYSSSNISKIICNYALSLGGITGREVITDAMAGLGGNTIAFARAFARVNAIELDPSRVLMLDHNIKTLGITNVIIRNDYFQRAGRRLTQDIIFFDPPWGLDYRKHALGTNHIQVAGPSGNISVENLVKLVSARTRYCIVMLPVNYDMDYFWHEIYSVGREAGTLTFGRPDSCIVAFVKCYAA